jgi:hypothetical protein
MNNNTDRIFVKIKKWNSVIYKQPFIKQRLSKSTLQIAFTSQQTHCIFVTKINRLMLYMETFQNKISESKVKPTSKVMLHYLVTIDP